MLLSKIIMIYGPQKSIGKRAYCASTFITKIDLETIDNIDQINILDTNMKGTYRLTCCYKYIVTRIEKQYNKELDVYKEMCEKKN